MVELQAVLSWLQANAPWSWLQAAAPVAQAFAAVAAIPIAVLAANRGAERGARRAFELSEEKEGKKLREQILLLRFLLGLELQSNLNDLKRFYNNLPISLPDEESYDAPEGMPDAHIEAPGRGDARQRSIVLYMPDFSYRFWHSQQLSSLLPMALDKTELRKVSVIYSSLDRLLKVKNIMANHAVWRSEAPLHAADKVVVEPSLVTISPKELRDLSVESDSIIQEVIQMDNPLKDAIDERGVGRHIAETASVSQAKLKS